MCTHLYACTLHIHTLTCTHTTQMHACIVCTTPMAHHTLICRHTLVHTDACSHTHACSIHSHKTCVYAHTFTCMCMPHTSCTCAHLYTHIFTQVRMCPLTHLHAHILTHTCTQGHTHTHLSTAESRTQVHRVDGQHQKQRERAHSIAAQSQSTDNLENIPTLRLVLSTGSPGPLVVLFTATCLCNV